MAVVIVTFTANPSLDRTSLLAGPLDPVGVNQVIASTIFPGGRGFHVSAALAAADRSTLAVMPAMKGGPLDERLRRSGVPHQIIPVPRHARTNITVTHNGVATVFSEPGIALEPETVTAMVSSMMAHSPGASWVVLCGSLPPGAPLDLYQRLCQIAHAVGAKVAVHTAGPALTATANATGDCTPDVLALNTRQLGHFIDQDLTTLPADDLLPAAQAALRSLSDAPVPRILLTLGAAGGILAGPEGAWHSRSEEIPVVTATGRGATALAGYLMARDDGAEDPEALTQAMAYGTARTTMDGAVTPTPADADGMGVRTSPIDLA
ncbi:MAG: 1-phosphofructokinase family hexose kinase [Propioniciclava sp.]